MTTTTTLEQAPASTGVAPAFLSRRRRLLAAVGAGRAAAVDLVRAERPHRAPWIDVTSGDALTLATIEAMAASGELAWTRDGDGPDELVVGDRRASDLGVEAAVLLRDPIGAWPATGPVVGDRATLPLRVLQHGTVNGRTSLGDLCRALTILVDLGWAAIRDADVVTTRRGRAGLLVLATMLHCPTER